MQTQYESLTRFTDRLYQIEQTKNDYIAPAKMWGMSANDKVAIKDVGQFNITNHAENQIADYYGIPRKYYEQTKQVPGLTAMNVNMWLKNNPDERRYLRTLDGNVRAFLSNGFKPLDNYDVMMESILPVIEPMANEIEIKSLALSETRMYFQVIFKKFQAEIRPGEIISYGVTGYNSEVGAGSLNFEDWLYYYVCGNGAARHSIFKKYHVGRRMEGEDEGIWKPDTLQAELKSYKLRLRDTLNNAFTQENFDKQIAIVKGAVKDEVKDLDNVVLNVTKRYGFSESDGKAIMLDMAEKKSYTRWGVINGITQLAHNESNPDKQYQIEKAGGELLDIKNAEWEWLNTEQDKKAKK